MRKYLKSLMVAVTGIALVGAAAHAYVGQSIKAENTFDFYENEFDFMLMPAKLAGQDSTLGEGHKLVEGFSGYRLFTNLTNQAGTDTYQIGGIVPIPNNMGNIGILFDYRNEESDDENRNGTITYIDFDNDDLTFGDTLLNQTDVFSEWEEEAINLYLGYGLPIPGTPVSVGLSYTYGISEGDAKGLTRVTNHSVPEESDPNTFTKTVNKNGITDSDHETETHEIALEGRFNQSPLDCLLGVSWRMIDAERDSGSGSKSTTETDTSLSNSGNWDEMDTYDNGSSNRDGDEWSVYTENIFELNPTVAFGLDLGYTWGDYDADLHGSTASYSSYEDDSVIMNYLDYTDKDLSGDIESEEFNARVELRLTFPKVRFGLGAAYNLYEEDGDYKGDEERITTTYNQVDAWDGIEDYETMTLGNDVKVDKYYDYDRETLSFPVATEFNITERLVCRLGVEFVIGETEIEYEEKITGNPNTSSTYSDGAGNSSSTDNVDGSYTKTLTAYDNEDTFSDTIYNAGLGYQVTENLTVDAMWRGTNGGNREAVDTNDLYIGATLAF